MTVEADIETTEPIYVNSDNHLKEVVDEHDIVLVDFFADWCGPCKMLEPTLKTVAMETAATVAKVDVDKHQQLAQSFGVRGVPTIVLFANGETVERHTGVLQEEQIRELINAHAN